MSWLGTSWGTFSTRGFFEECGVGCLSLGQRGLSLMGACNGFSMVLYVKWFSCQLVMPCSLTLAQRGPSFKVKVAKAGWYEPLWLFSPKKIASSLEVFVFFFLRGSCYLSSLVEDLETVLAVSSLNVRTRFWRNMKMKWRKRGICGEGGQQAERPRALRCSSW